MFDVFAPSQEDIEETDGRWLEREPGIFERADWDEDVAHADPVCPLGRRQRRRSPSTGSTSPDWRALIDEAGFEIESLYGWFDRRPYDGGEDMIWVCRRVAADDAAH